MSASGLRLDGRRDNEIRQVKVEHNVFGYARSSVLFSMGTTKILCGVTIQDGVPHFLRGKKTGWLTAEYAMLPFATHTRISRNSEGCLRRDGRSVEISRFIGRSLRSVADLTVLGEQTIIVDCQVLQADGGTRVASITAASVALDALQQELLAAKVILKPLLRDRIVGLSAALTADGRCLLDPTYQEDSGALADFNFVIGATSSALVELQGTAESSPIPWATFLVMSESVRTGAAGLATSLSSLSSS